MNYPRYSNEDVQKRIVRFDELTREPGTTLMFIDSVLPRHMRMNYAIIGDTASENPDFKPAITGPHKFQIGLFMCPPMSGPAYHTHDYIELFMPLSGEWRFYWGNDPEGEPEGEAVLKPKDMISMLPGLWRGFENISSEDAWCFAVLEPHEVFTGKDPYWSQKVIDQAKEYGFLADERGKMIRPANYEEQKTYVEDVLLHRVPPRIQK